MNSQELLDQTATWSIEEKVQFFVDWMMAERDSKLKTTFFVSWMRAERGNKKFLRDIADKAAAVYVTEGFAKRDYAAIEHWIERVIDKKKSPTDQIAHTCKNSFGLPEKMVPLLKKVIRRKKQNKLVRENYRRKVNADPRWCGRATAFKRLLAEDTYAVGVSLAEREGVDLPGSVAPAQLPLDITRQTPSLDSQTKTEDYHALISPHRKLLAEIASLEVLDELLRLLYEQGDVPSVVAGQGKTYDGEYRKLQSHTQFLKILQGISLYDLHLQCPEGCPGDHERRSTATV